MSGDVGLACVEGVEGVENSGRPIIKKKEYCEDEEDEQY